MIDIKSKRLSKHRNSHVGSANARVSSSRDISKYMTIQSNSKKVCRALNPECLNGTWGHRGSALDAGI
jgi:hypothetical protein